MNFYCSFIYAHLKAALLPINIMYINSNATLNMRADFP